MTANVAALPADADRTTPKLGGFNLTFLRLEIRRLLRNRRTLFFILIFPILLFSFIAGPQINKTLNGPGTPKVGPYIMISMAVYGAVVACTSGGAMVAVERALGWSRQLRLTPLRPAAYIVTKLLTAMVLGFIAVVVMMVVGAAFGVRMPTHVWLISGVAAWGCSVVFAAFGLFMGYLLPAENVMQYLGPMLALFAFLGGIFIPLETEPHALQVLAKFIPVYGVAAIARAPLFQTGVAWTAVVNVLAWLVIFGVGAAMLFRRDTKRV